MSKPTACHERCDSRSPPAFPEHTRSARPLHHFARSRSGRRSGPVFWKRNGRAHCGTDIEGGYLYTLTLTDVATGWTECLPLLHRREVPVLAALQRARTLFPFPILGIDTDNGGEFINDAVITYCEQEQITFTRG